MTLPPALAVLLLPLAVGLLVVGMWLVRLAGRRYGWSAEIQRKAVHVATGLFAISLPWLLPEAWLVYGLLALAVAVMAVLRIPSIATAGAGAALHGVERKSWGDFMLVAAVATLYFFSGQAAEPVLYVLPLAVLTLSDAAAALAGSSYGRMRYTIEEGQKSIEGSVIFFMVTWILAMVALLLLSDVPRANVVLLSLITASFGTVVEADSWRGFDNYFVPVGVLFLLAVHMESAPWVLLLLALGFLAAFTLLRVYGGALLDISVHTARAYTAALFMIGAVVAPVNIILPASTLVAQAYARRHNPSNARHPDLDMLAMLAVVSFVAFFGGLALDSTAISFYALICAGIIAQLLVLAVAGRPVWVLVGTAAIVLIGLSAIVSGVIAFNPEISRWHGPILPFIVISLLVCALAALLLPAFYRSSRHAKVAIVAALVPLASYLYLHFRQGGVS